MRQAEVRTDWTALLVSLAIQVPVVVWAIDQWGLGLIALGPFELARLLVLHSVSKAYREYGDPWHAVKSFVTGAGILLGVFVLVLLVPWIAAFGLHGFITLLSDASIWKVTVVPLGIVVAENSVSLFFFRGDVRVQAAMFDAMSSDALTWFGLVVLLIPAAILALLGVALWLGSGPGMYVPKEVFYLLAGVAMLYPAAYFAGKAIILAQVYTAHFALTGRRVLDAPWALFLTSSKGQRYKETVRLERHAVAWRRAAMLGDAALADSLESADRF